MIHLENHPHAYLDENNVVTDIYVFQESDHDTQLLEDIRVAKNAKQVVCCCTFGKTVIGQSWDNTTSSWVPLPPPKLPDWLLENN